MTKPIVATATMMLVEDGRLALDEPVHRLLPEQADRRVLKRVDGPLDDTVPANRPITVEDLLTFRMGYGMVFEPSFQPPYPVIKADVGVHSATMSAPKAAGILSISPPARTPPSITLLHKVCEPPKEAAGSG